MNACHSFVPQTTLPHPILQDEGLLRSSDERAGVSPSIINTIPGLLFSDWGLPNLLITPVHQADDSLGDNQCLLPGPPTLTHFPSAPVINVPMRKEDLTTKKCSLLTFPLVKCSICNHHTWRKPGLKTFPFSRRPRLDTHTAF